MSQSSEQCLLTLDLLLYDAISSPSLVALQIQEVPST